MFPSCNAVAENFVTETFNIHDFLFIENINS